MGMFDNYNNTTSNNLVKKLFIDNQYNDCIMPGSTCTHYFKLPFNYDKITSIKVVYKQLDRLTITKTISDLALVYDDKESNTCIMSCELSNEDTIKFDNTLLDTNVQLKVGVGANIIQSKVFKIKVLDNIEEIKDEK